MYIALHKQMVSDTGNKAEKNPYLTESLISQCVLRAWEIFERWGFHEIGRIGEVKHESNIWQSSTMKRSEDWMLPWARIAQHCQGIINQDTKLHFDPKAYRFHYHTIQHRTESNLRTIISLYLLRSDSEQLLRPPYWEFRFPRKQAVHLTTNHPGIK